MTRVSTLTDFFMGVAVNGPFAVGHLATVVLHRPGRADAARFILRAGFSVGRWR